MNPVTYTLETEPDIIKGCIEGKRSCQELIYKQHSPKMFGICLRYANDYQTAEDLLQEGFVKVYRNIHKFRSEGSFEGWVRRIFVNTAIEHYRRNVHMYPLQDYSEVDYQRYDNSTMNDLLEEDVMKLINELSPGYRTVFNMYVVEGFSHKEIAEELGISEGTSKSQLARARYILQKKLADSQKVAQRPKSGS